MKLARRSAPDARRADRPRTLTNSVDPPALLGRTELHVLITLAVLALIAVVAAAAAVSYSHMFDWALLNGEPRWRARLSPISVDGAILAASIVMFADARLRNRPDWMAYVIVFTSIGWSVFANVVHDWVSWVAAKLIAGWPPIAMAATVELLLRFARRLRERSDLVAQRSAKVEKALTTRGKPAVPVAPPTTPLPEAVETGTDVPAETVVESTVDLTAQMRAAGWAPSDYSNMGDAMLAYLRKVDPEAGGADLHRLVAAPFFGATKDTGRGRQIVRQFKEAQAAIASAAETGETRGE